MGASDQILFFFMLFDEDCSGTMDTEEFKHMIFHFMRSSSASPSLDKDGKEGESVSALMQMVFEACDKANTGYISFEEFKGWWGNEIAPMKFLSGQQKKLLSLRGGELQKDHSSDSDSDNDGDDGVEIVDEKTPDLLQTAPKKNTVIRDTGRLEHRIDRRTSSTKQVKSGGQNRSLRKTSSFEMTSDGRISIADCRADSELHRRASSGKVDQASLLKLFKKYDEDKDGHLSVQEFAKLVRCTQAFDISDYTSSEIPPSLKEKLDDIVAGMYASIDTEGKGEISDKDLKRWLAENPEWTKSFKVESGIRRDNNAGRLLGQLRKGSMLLRRVGSAVTGLKKTGSFLKSPNGISTLKKTGSFLISPTQRNGKATPKVEDTRDATVAS